MLVWRIRSWTAYQQGKFAGVSRATALMAGLSLFVPLLAAHAQQAPEIIATTSPSPGLEEIVVTARRKSELLQDVPQTVTPVTAADIQKFNLQTMSEIAQVVPGLQIVAAGNRSLDIKQLSRRELPAHQRHAEYAGVLHQRYVCDQ